MSQGLSCQMSGENSPIAKAGPALGVGEQGSHPGHQLPKGTVLLAFFFLSPLIGWLFLFPLSCSVCVCGGGGQKEGWNENRQKT